MCEVQQQQLANTSTNFHLNFENFQLFFSSLL
jgi:hypothetical protein